YSRTVYAYTFVFFHDLRFPFFTCFFFYGYVAPRDLHSFPTRRSSDLKIYDPATTRPDPSRPGASMRDPFAGNLIRSNRINPVSRSEEHTSELQSLRHLVCRLLLEKKNPSAIGTYHY